MNNNEFTLKRYEEILISAISGGYDFINFEQIDKNSSPYNCILRHDIDVELLSCLPILEVERECNIKATYFLMLRSTAYNLLCIESKRIIERILEDGHKIGLHFMNEFYNDNSPSAVIKNILYEKSTLENELEVKINSFSFHQPSQEILNSQINIPSMVNTYRKDDMGDFYYMSDTNMRWREEHPIDIFTKKLHSNLQLLIHPIWWTENFCSIQDKWKNTIISNNKVVLRHWIERERSLSHHTYTLNFDLHKSD